MAGNEITYKNLSYKIGGLAMEVQVINYLKATGVKLAIILNFGKQELEI